jgi:NAD(P)-dependent dehydrogenase (short-subunit alcohol dehydrogenase family)
MARRDFAPGVCIVTGGGSGIGRAIAAELVSRGGRVVVADLDGQRARAVAGELGPPAEAAVVDVADPEAVRALVSDTVTAHGRLDVMVNNAGVAVGGFLEELDERHWSRALDVNLRGVVHGVSAAYPVMSAQRSGHILNTASLAGLVPAPGMLPYTTTKHAVVGLSLALRAEAAGRGVGVSVLFPAVVDTPLLDDVHAAPASLGGPSVRARIRLAQPRFLTPEHVARRAVEGLAANRAVIPVGALAQTLWRVHRYAPALMQGVARLQVTTYRRLERSARRSRGSD